MYITDSFARIRCSECNKIIDELRPGKKFESIKKCSCAAPVVKPKPRAKPKAKEEDKAE